MIRFRILWRIYYFFLTELGIGMKTLTPIASPRVLTRITLTTVITILLLAVSAACLPVPAFAQLAPELKEGLDNQKAGRLKEAVEVYTEVIGKNPRSAEAYNWRGMAEEDLGQLDQALADYNKAIEISPDYADAYNNRGEVYRKKNMIPQATADYRKAGELDKNFAEAFYNMGLMHELQKRGGLAVREYESYLKLKPDAPDKQHLLDKIEELKKSPGFQQAAPPASEKKPGERPGMPKALPEKKPGEAPAVPKAMPEKKAGEAPAVPKALPEKKAGERPGVPKPGMPMKPAIPPPPGGVDLGIPGVPQLPMSTDMLMTLAAGAGLIGIIIPVLIYLFTSIMFFLIAKKTNTSLPWLAFIPIANVILMLNIARKPIWWLVLLFLPAAAMALPLLEAIISTGGILPAVLGIIFLLAAVVAWLLVNLGIARARGKSAIWGVLLFIPCTNPIALAYLGLSK
jgi:tetratricopeptide (TPR) repeat protein